MNVIAWNVLTPHTLASGGDEGRLRVWDLRAFEQPVADFNHHRCACRQHCPPPHCKALAFVGHLAPVLTDHRRGSIALCCDDPEDLKPEDLVKVLHPLTWHVRC